MRSWLACTTSRECTTNLCLFTSRHQSVTIVALDFNSQNTMLITNPSPKNLFHQFYLSKSRHPRPKTFLFLICTALNNICIELFWTSLQITEHHYQQPVGATTYVLDWQPTNKRAGPNLPNGRTRLISTVFHSSFQWLGKIQRHEYILKTITSKLVERIVLRLLCITAGEERGIVSKWLEKLPLVAC